MDDLMTDVDLQELGCAPTGDEVLQYLQRKRPEVIEDAVKTIALQKMARQMQVLRQNVPQVDADGPEVVLPS